jgi:hypothetical protein
MQTMMTHGENQTTADSGAGIEIVSMPAELDLTTSEGAAAQGCAAIARLARLVLLDLAGLSFCDARGLSAFARSPTRPTRPGAVSASSRRGRWSRRSCGSAAWTAGCRCSPAPTTRWRCSRPRQRFSARDAQTDRKALSRRIGQDVVHSDGVGFQFSDQDHGFPTLLCARRRIARRCRANGRSLHAEHGLRNIPGRAALPPQ